MTVVCSKCAARFTCLIVLKERAIADLSKQITNHWTIKHREEMQVTAKGILEAQMAFAWYLTISSLCFIPTDEKILLEEKEKALDITMSALGYDDSDDEEDEEIEPGDDNKDDENDDEDDAFSEPLQMPLESDVKPAETTQAT